ncbi:hypothetical protein [Caballeronia sp. SBC1]|uniref:hypothetical protein n=1 Tax=Caballeronia sp. SBC1 TaxID=2705548 RepID=UPI001FB6E9E2|nr:hypothetical protein [Caballeronia sp. SBC1]
MDPIARFSAETGMTASALPDEPAEPDEAKGSELIEENGGRLRLKTRLEIGWPGSEQIAVL